MPATTWDDPVENSRAAELKIEGKDCGQIGRILGRSTSSVYQFLRRNYPELFSTQAAPQPAEMTYREKTTNNDLDFIRSMREAIACGHEKVSEGTYVADDKDFRPYTPRIVGCVLTRSIFADVAEMGEAKW